MTRTFSSFTLAEAMQLIPADRMTPWNINAPPLLPSATITDYLRRLQVFDLENTEAAKLLLIDALFAEIVPNHAGLKIWKGMPLKTDSLDGFADYLISPDYAYLKTPLLCVTEAKRDDFLQGRAQCIAELVACRWNNQREGHEMDVYGVVSNGQNWRFYRLTATDAIYESPLYNITALPELLGALDSISAHCAENAPQ